MPTPRQRPTAATTRPMPTDFTAGLMDAQSDSYVTKDGFAFEGLLDQSKLQAHNVTVWKPGEGKHYMAIIPYRRGEQDPYVVMNSRPAGHPAYILKIFRHRNIAVHGTK